MREYKEIRCHELKTLIEHFEDVTNRSKKAELRKNDRDFRIGDFLLLKEWDGESYTGYWFLARITHVLIGSDYVQKGHAMLSFEMQAGHYRETRSYDQRSS